jgi:hypothetical protein
VVLSVAKPQPIPNKYVGDKRRAKQRDCWYDLELLPPAEYVSLWPQFDVAFGFKLWREIRRPIGPVNTRLSGGRRELSGSVFHGSIHTSTGWCSSLETEQHAEETRITMRLNGLASKSWVPSCPASATGVERVYGQLLLGDGVGRESSRL